MKNQLAAERAARAGSAAGGASNEVSIATFEALKTAMNECDKDVKKSISCNENASAGNRQTKRGTYGRFRFYFHIFC